jgi:hypothetical protein
MSQSENRMQPKRETVTLNLERGASFLQRKQAKKPLFEELSEEIQEVYQEKQKIKEGIRQIYNRLRFHYSEPLHDYWIEQIKKDMALTCKMTDLLCKQTKS